MQLLALDINWNLYVYTGVGVIMLVYYNTIIKCYINERCKTIMFSSWKWTKLTVKIALSMT